MPALPTGTSTMLISLKPVWARMVARHTKLHELRRFRARFSWAFVYVTQPVGAIRLFMELDTPLYCYGSAFREQPCVPGHARIREAGSPYCQTAHDNDLPMDYRGWAWPIMRVWQAAQPIPLATMREMGLHPPQSVRYLDGSQTQHLMQILALELLWERVRIPCPERLPSHSTAEGA